jgi:two-component system, NarL family, nitrate/nitrite response regulator NarL
MKRIIIAEDNKLYRDTLKTTLSHHEIVGEAEDGEAAIELVRLKKPDLLILDLSMPKTYGFQVIGTLKKEFPKLKILVLSIHNTAEFCRVASKAGIEGYCLKDEGRENILKSVECVLEGGTYFSAEVMDIIQHERGQFKGLQERT